MRDYAKISPKFWTGETGQELARRGFEGLVVALYLMSSPHSNMLGLYYQPVLYLAEETGLSPEGALKGLQVCKEVGFCDYDPVAKMVWVYEMASYQIASELSPKDLRCKGVQKEYSALPNNLFLGPFFDRYGSSFNMTDRREYAAKGKGHQPSLLSPYEAPTKPRTGTEQEQEQDQDSPSLRSGESAGKPASTRPKREETTLKTYLENCRQAGMRPLPPDHAIRDYCRDAGISDEMLQVAWCVFRDDYTTGTSKGKKYKDWPGHFANAVRGCWAKLWWTDNGQVAWTSRGMQEKAVLDARARAKGAGNDAT